MSTQTIQPFRTPWAVGLANQFNLQTLPRHANQILIAAGIYQGLFTIVAPIVSRWLVPDTYNKLDERTRTNWRVRFVSFAQAVFVCTKALSVIFTDPSRKTATGNERLWGYSPQAGTVQAYAAGYFLWDIYISLRYPHVDGGGGMLHAICAFVVTMVGFVGCQ